jgi:transposase InsO family protein
VAVLDWYSRYVFSWALSATLEGSFCVWALQEALERGRPEVFNRDQGTQFTSEAFMGCLERRGVAISMDGRGRVYDNIFVGRLWRTVKYEEVYLKPGRPGRGWRGTSASTIRSGYTRGWAIGHRRRCTRGWLEAGGRAPRRARLLELQSPYGLLAFQQPPQGETLLSNPVSCPNNGEHLSSRTLTSPPDLADDAPKVGD